MMRLQNLTTWLLKLVLCLLLWLFENVYYIFSTLRNVKSYTKTSMENDRLQLHDLLIKKYIAQASRVSKV